MFLLAVFSLVWAVLLLAVSALASVKPGILKMTLILGQLLTISFFVLYLGT